MTRLERLCRLHEIQGGTIHQFNELYDTKFLSLTDDDFNYWLSCVTQDKVFSHHVPHETIKKWKSLEARISSYPWIERGNYEY